MAFVYRDQENDHRNLLKNKVVNENNVFKRSVLGVLNVNTVSNAQNKNIGNKKTKIKVQAPKKPIESFVVHEDNPIKENVTAKVIKEDKLKKTNNFIIPCDDSIELVPSLPANKLAPKRQPLKDVSENVPRTEKTPESEEKCGIASKDSQVDQKTEDQICILKHFDDEYSVEILGYMRSLESGVKARPYYMRKQPDITPAMRTILVDWLVEVADEYNLQSQTLFLAISFIDRFLSAMSVVKSKLQLLGTAAMFVAAKYEEIYPPEIAEFVYITDDTYTEKQVLRMEYLLLKVLKFAVSAPTMFTFLVHYAAICDLPDDIIFMAQYLCELVLLEGDPYLQYYGSLIAASAIALAQHCLGKDDVWPSHVSKVTGYQLSNLADCIGHLNETLKNVPNAEQQAIRLKYSHNKFRNVSDIPFEKPLIVDEYILQMKELKNISEESS